VHVIGSIAGSVADPHFGNALANRLDVARVTVSKPTNPVKDPDPCLQVAKPREPLVELIRDFDLKYALL